MAEKYNKAQFERAVAIVKELPADGPVKPSTDDKLTFYKYFKQATVGPVDAKANPRPGMLDFVGKAKWDAWNSLGEGVSKEDAQHEYVKTLLALLEQDPGSAAFVTELKALA
ncbi:acyl-CoA-binding protein [Mycena galopus ATCC 62051]|nr:acyl-CoA-binding protein [Mycena galopus ATCC 62051]